jgi:hypothetical protein
MFSFQTILLLKIKEIIKYFIYIYMCVCVYVKQINYNYNKQNILMRSILHLDYILIKK